MPPQFQSWLENNRYSPNTIRSYLRDISSFFTFLSSLKLSNIASDSAPLFSEKNLNLYLSHIYHKKDYKRRLASLKVYCQFAQDQKLIHYDVLKKALSLNVFFSNSEKVDSTSMLAEFNKFLISQNSSASTLKNYTADIKDYLNFANQNAESK